LIAYYATVCVTRPRMILLLILIPVLLLVSGGLRLQFDADTRTFVGHDGAHAQALQQFEHYFGSANLVIFIVTARSGHIIEEDSLIAIQELTDKARLMPFSTQVQSLSTIQQLLIVRPSDQRRAFVYQGRHCNRPNAGHCVPTGV